MTRKEFNKWVNYQIKMMTRQIGEDVIARVSLSSSVRKRIVLIDTLAITVNPQKRYISIVNTLTGRIGVAKCHKDDKMDIRIGIAIAWARYNGVSIPVVHEIPLSELKIGDYFKGLLTGKKFYLVGYTPVGFNYETRKAVCIDQFENAILFKLTTNVEKIERW